MQALISQEITELYKPKVGKKSIFDKKCKILKTFKISFLSMEIMKYDRNNEIYVKNQLIMKIKHDIYTLLGIFEKKFFSRKWLGRPL